MGNKKIQINPEKLKAITAAFEQSKGMLMTFSFEAPVKTCHGVSIKELCTIESEYISLKNTVVKLINKTKDFMVQSATDVSALDTAIAKGMKLGE